MIRRYQEHPRSLLHSIPDMHTPHSTSKVHIFLRWPIDAPDPTCAHSTKPERVGARNERDWKLAPLTLTLHTSATQLGYLAVHTIILMILIWIYLRPVHSHKKHQALSLLSTIPGKDNAA